MVSTSTFSRVALFLLCAGVFENTCAMQQLALTEQFAEPSQQAGAKDVQESLLTHAQQIRREQAEPILRASSPSTVGGDPADLAQLQHELEQEAARYKQEHGNETESVQELMQKAYDQERVHNYSEAFELYIRAACLGNDSEPAERAGSILSCRAYYKDALYVKVSDGIIVNFNKKFTIDRVCALFSAAAGCGNERALVELGEAYRHSGQKERAERVWNLCGQVLGQKEYSRLGDMYFYEMGAEKKYKAVAYYRKAGDLGLAAKRLLHYGNGKEWPSHAYAALSLYMQGAKKGEDECAYQGVRLCKVMEAAGCMVDGQETERLARKERDAAYQFAQNCMRKGEHDKAIEFIEIASKDPCYSVDAAFCIADCYVAKGDLEAADRVLQKTIIAAKAKAEREFKIDYPYGFDSPLGDKAELCKGYVADNTVSCLMRYGAFLRDKKRDYVGAKKQFEQACEAKNGRGLAQIALADLYQNQFHDPVRAEGLYCATFAIDQLAALWEKSTVPWQQDFVLLVKPEKQADERSIYLHQMGSYLRGFLAEHTGIEIEDFDDEVIPVLRKGGAGYWYAESIIHDSFLPAVMPLARVVGIERARCLVSRLKNEKFRQQAQASLNKFEKTKADDQAADSSK